MYTESRLLKLLPQVLIRTRRDSVAVHEYQTDACGVSSPKREWSGSWLSALASRLVPSTEIGSVGPIGIAFSKSSFAGRAKRWMSSVKWPSRSPPDPATAIR